MTDDTQTPPGDQKTFSEADVAAAIANAVEEATAGLKAKNAELLGETKAEREKRQAIEKERAEAEEERQRQNGEHQKLYETELQKRQRLEQEMQEYRATIAKRDVEAATGKIGSELTRDTAKAALLAKEAAAYAKHGDDGVAFEIGGVVVDRAAVLDHLKSSYPFLVDGNQSNGGGASGGSGGAAHDLSKLGDAERLKLAREGKLRKPA